MEVGIHIRVEHVQKTASQLEYQDKFLVPSYLVQEHVSSLASG